MFLVNKEEIKIMNKFKILINEELYINNNKSIFNREELDYEFKVLNGDRKIVNEYDSVWSIDELIESDGEVYLYLKNYLNNKEECELIDLEVIKIN